MWKRILWCLLAASGCATAFAQIGQLENLYTRHWNLTQTGDSVDIELTIDLSRVHLNRQQRIELTPVLMAADGTRQLELPAATVNGLTRHRVMNRRAALGADSPLPPERRVCRINGTQQTLHYRVRTAYARWMRNGSLLLSQRMEGCAACTAGSANTTVAQRILPAGKPVYALHLREPEEERVKHRQQTYTIRLLYRQNSGHTDPAYRNNAESLNQMMEWMQHYTTDSDLVVTGIFITGYASPEGPREYNLRLSEKRARSLAEWIRQHAPENGELPWHIDWKGEDWEGLRLEVRKHPRLLAYDRVMAIIDGCDTDADACEQKLRTLLPPDTYTRLLNEMFGPLRRNECRVTFDVRNFTDEEAAKRIDSRPELVSLKEMYRLALKAGKGSPRFVKLMETAARIYPESRVARCNAAIARIESGQPQEAVALLEEYDGDAECLNVLGVAHAACQQWEKARFCLQKAADMGSREAVDNLNIVNNETTY